MMRRIRREPGVAQQAVREIRAAILAGDLAPGKRIRQEKLAARLAISREPIRQALLVLEREGLVHSDPGRGSIVAPLDPEFIRDLFELRGFIEREVAMALAARPHALSGRSRQTVAAGREAASAGDLGRLIDLDEQFHTELYDALDNQVLSDVMAGQWTHIRRAVRTTLTLTLYPRQLWWDEHAAILDAIDRRDVNQAGRVAAAHIEAASRVFLEGIARLQPHVADPATGPRDRPRKPEWLHPRRHIVS